MAKHSVDLSPLAEEALLEFIADLNVNRRATGLPPYASTDEFLQEKQSELMEPVIASYNARHLAPMIAALQEAGLEKRAEVATSLGVVDLANQVKP